VFEDEAAREQARMRLLNAAKKFKIVPVGTPPILVTIDTSGSAFLCR
jgi:hypothetical protein